MSRRIAALCCLLMLFVAAGGPVDCCYAAAPSPQQTINGMQKLCEQDNPAWAIPGQDDSSCRSVMIPGSWQSQHLRLPNKIGWYRIHFTPDDNITKENLGVFLGRIGDSDEVYLNGMKIGGEGVVGAAFVEAADVERLYRIPQGLMKYDEENLLAVRVMNTFVRGGIFESSIRIGDYDDLYREKIRNESARRQIQLTYFLIIQLFVIFVILRYMAGVKEKEYVAFAIFVFLAGFYWAFHSLIFYESGLKSPQVQQFIYVVRSLVPISIAVFMATAFRDWPPLFIRTISALTVVVLLGDLFLLHNPAWLRTIDFVWSVICVGNVVGAIYLSVRAYQRKVPESTPLIIGVVVMGFTVISEVLAWQGVMDVGSYYFTAGVEFGVLFWIFCAAYSMDMRFARSLKTMRAFSQRIISAHDEERRRIAYDLHDGLGQSLLALKLKIQMFMANRGKRDPQTGREMADVLSDVTDTIGELRQISRDLRPSLPDKMSVEEVLKWYGRRVERQTGLKVFFESGVSVGEADRTVKEHLYRICQEAVNNCCRHSGADTLRISLQRRNTMIALTLADNGRGFVREQVQDDGGLGLQTMQERAEMLGGTCVIKSSPEMGTQILVEVPAR